MSRPKSVPGSDSPKVKRKVVACHAKATAIGEESPHPLLPAEPRRRRPSRCATVAAFDFRTVGVRQTASGKWEVGFRYHGSRRSFGTYVSQDLAASANKVARQLLTVEVGVKLTAEEIDENVKLARAASVEAVSKIQHEEDTPPDEENRLKILLLSEEVVDRPSLLSSQLQPEKTFAEWLTHGKNEWKAYTWTNKLKEKQQKARNNNKAKARILLSNSESHLASSKQNDPDVQRGTALDMAQALLSLSTHQGETAKQREATQKRRPGRPFKAMYPYDPALVAAPSAGARYARGLAVNGLASGPLAGGVASRQGAAHTTSQCAVAASQSVPSPNAGSNSAAARRRHPGPQPR